MWGEWEKWAFQCRGRLCGVSTTAATHPWMFASRLRFSAANGFDGISTGVSMTHTIPEMIQIAFQCRERLAWDFYSRLETCPGEVACVRILFQCREQLVWISTV